MGYLVRRLDFRVVLVVVFLDDLRLDGFFLEIHEAIFALLVQSDFEEFFIRINLLFVVNAPELVQGGEHVAELLRLELLRLLLVLW